ncbi:probable pectinesterase 53 [Selaginella moellendorffii]|nr:probable pectinesterase 53 [Selaginella moellendorffii]|eukprot:XP_002961718.2 probable pectinesterase 53 [Selaginella moellendorffii]
MALLLVASVDSWRNASIPSQWQGMTRRSKIHPAEQQGGDDFIPRAIGGDGLVKFLVVDQSSLLSSQTTGVFRSIQAAIDAVPVGNQHWVIIQVGAGVYQEKITIPYMKPYILLQGAGRDFTTISWSDTASTFGTANSATFSAFAPNFIAKYISFRNNAPRPPPGAFNRQAVAVLVAGDMAAFYSCGFYGAQDTLFDYEGRHYFRDCYIEGSIDFIFGHAKSVFKACELHAIADSFGSVTAQNRGDPRENSGFIFIACTVTGSGTIFLGRAWGAYSRVVYLFTYMDSNVVSEGWNDWGVASRQETVYYGQYKCFGPGANELGRVRWSHELTDEEARPFLQVNFIDGVQWLREL